MLFQLKKKNPSLFFQLEMNFPGMEETEEAKNQRITDRLWYMGFSKKHLETLQDLNPVISPLLADLLLESSGSPL
ncbi:hypothetical protein AF332_25565 [Sporosarcina globispora]|uniref:Uncharacterized protein n=1 Tax=Sporosarcina globispora TaxID=1459 RepID=A0A0M0GK35_SPOGL|nr:hypothetical protein [Sporosarcina globispora]KON89852.1 hypothetical protein AF332_25565 [Sporosarcina globispora]